MTLKEFFTFKKPEPEKRSKGYRLVNYKQPKLIIDNDKAYGSEMKRLMGPRVDRLDGDFNTNLIRTATINNEIRGNVEKLRDMSRTLTVNSPFAKHAAQYQIDNVIGEGINPQLRILQSNGKPNKKLNSAISNQFYFWADSAKRFSKNERMNWRRFQEMVERSRFVDGEVFIRIYETETEFKLELIEAARCKFGERATTENGYILDGIEYDASNTPIRYYFDSVNQSTQTASGKSYSVEASDIIHYFKDEFPDQRRGYPEITPNIDVMNQYDAFTKATLVQKRATASSMGFITQDKDGQDNIELDDDNEMQETPEIIQNFESGTIHQLPAGYDIKQFSSTQGGDDYLNFTSRLEDMLAMGYGFYKQGWKGDTSGINYSAARFGDLTQRNKFRSVQRNVKEQVFETIFERWLTWMIMQERIQMRMTAIPEVLRQTVWTYPKWASIDPSKDAQKDALDVENGFKSAADVIIERGEDPELVFAQIEQEKTRFVPKYSNQIAVASVAADAQVEVAEINSDNSQENI
ncbi:phage portal protein [Escherichia coli]|uniref:phage portal protein n=1 Tax=Escherichia coli TaxID=562 RepID=UPI00301B9BB3